MDKLQVSATFPDIKPENLSEFKKLAAEMLEITRAEQGTLQYDYFLNSDENRLRGPRDLRQFRC